MPKKYSLSFIGFVLTFVGSIMFSTKAIIVKKAFANIEIDALSLLTLRMLFALPFYIVVLFVSKQRNAALRVKQWLQLIAVGLLGYYVSSYLDFEGLRYISAGLERLILFLYPSFVVLINAFVFRQHIQKNQRIALLLTYSGIGLAYAGEFNLYHLEPGFFIGGLLIFLCSITYAFYIVGSGRLIPLTGATKFTSYAMLAATAGIFIHFLLKHEASAIVTVAKEHWEYGLLLGIIATVLPSYLIAGGTKRIGSNNVAIISSIGPVSTILQAWWFLGETIHWSQLAGTVLVIGGILILGLKKQSA
ncbi:EamA domain-containing membrane protein RarD [Lacibacter cauensis]|uniref:EamA domain-containing membrane protein RarD n=1 Tax=Lacibacter cauensis TaxID=510947 RepID=A0A562SWX9_9BACT|nr:DMT family transporter [Lacibacter cauensis]TWI85484.1 EamA domain-containing membrane protein RarD [Lacibacter cauensis]